MFISGSKSSANYFYILYNHLYVVKNSTNSLLLVHRICVDNIIDIVFYVCVMKKEVKWF